VPRTNRGIFAVNELPDLAERIQVGLLNALEERDVQVRGYQIRLPLDVLFVASANPEDYTSRGRLITPLKDRFGSQIRTHYPLDVATELAIMEQERRRFVDSRGDGPRVDVDVPEYLREVIATVSHVARGSSHVNQRSGVSVRLSVTNLEAVAANALRRGLRAGETSTVARVDDLAAMSASSSGKIEIETLDDGAHGAIFDNLVRSAVLTVFRDRVPAELTRAVTQAFDDGAVIDVGEDVPSELLADQVATIPALSRPVDVLTGGDDSPPAVAAAVAFILEGLHLSKRLNKDVSGSRAVYRAR
jgi:magnesium chelatase subunit I